MIPRKHVSVYCKAWICRLPP